MALYGAKVSDSSPNLDFTLGSSHEVNFVSFDIPIKDIFELFKSEFNPVKW